MEGIAIVGLAGRFPGAPDTATFWRNLQDGIESISTLSEDELRDAGVPTSLYDDPAYVRARGLLEGAEMFDAPFFGCTPREAALMDPQHRIFLRCAHEALEDAGCDPRRQAGAIGVYAGSSLNTYLLANLCRDRAFIDDFTRAFQAGGYDILLGNDKDYLATRVSYRLGLRGPSLTIQSACSTSLVAVVTACQALATWQCDVALAGGVSVTFPQHRGYLYEEGGIMSRDGRCRPFDEAACGTVFGGGVGVVALKRVEDAVADGDRIYCVIRGFALNNDGASKVSYMAPSPEGQAEVIATAHALAGVTADSITYVEAHGTGTPVGDPIEVAGLTRAFRATTAKTGFCALGSVKANVGHLEAAAGVTGLIKTALMLAHRTLVPTPHFTAPNPQIDFTRTPFTVQARREPWTSNGTPLRAGVSAFGVGGTNAHVVLEEAPAPAAVPPAPPSSQVLVVSARTPAALDAAATRLADDLERHPQRPLADVAWTLQTGRTLQPCRRAVACEGTAEAVAALRDAAPRRRVDGATPRVAFLFPGQGAQQAGMLANTYASEPAYRDEVDACCDILAPHLGLDLRPLLLPAPSAVDEANERLRQTALTQPALFVTEYALARLWMSWGIEPTCMIGHSVGEYVAACLSGVLSRDDALTLVAARGRLMQALPPGQMVAVRAPEREVSPLVDDPALSIAAVNSPVACVVAGPAEAVDRLCRRVEERGLGWRMLPTSHAFHSPMMDPIEAPFTRLVLETERKAPRIPYVSNVTGTWITAQEVADERYWFRHLRQGVRFADGIETLCQESPLVLLEVGPGQILSNQARQHPASHGVVSITASAPSGDDRVHHALAELWTAGVAPRWEALHAQRPRKVSLPAYPFEETRCWIAPPAAVEGEARRPLVEAAEITEMVAASTAPGAIGAAPEPSGALARLLDALSQISGHESIDPRSSFFDLGFDSLSLTQVVADVRARFGVSVAFRELMGALSTPALLAERLERDGATTGGAPASGPTSAAGPVPPRVMALSQAQREVWLACQMSPDATLAYNESYTLCLRGPLDVPALKTALGDLVGAHEALRLVVSSDGASQMVTPEGDVEVAFTDLSMLAPDARERRLAALIDESSGTAFNLEVGPLVRFSLVRAASDEHHLVITAHHVACDGWSFDVLIADLGLLYSARREGRTLSLERPRFSDYVTWDEALASERAADERWWEDRFTPVPAPLDLPHDRPRPPLRTYRAASRTMRIDPCLADALNQTASRQGCTLFVLLMAAWQAWLHRASGQHDIVVGFPVAGQLLSQRKMLVGQCANLLPLRGRVSSETRFGDLLATLRGEMLDALEHARVSFGRLVGRLPIARDAARVPLVSVHLNLDRAPTARAYAGLATDLRVNPRHGYTFDLGLSLEERDGSLLVHAFHNTALFSGAQIDALLASWRTMLEAVTADPTQEIGRLPVVDPDRERRLLTEINRVHEDLAGPRTLADLFEAAVEQDADALAVVRGEQRLSRSELNERANRLAHHLRRRGMAPGQYVAVLLDDPLAQVIASLAVVKAGGGYLPLDPALPVERLAFMLADCRPSLIVTTSRQLPVLGAAAGTCEAVVLDAQGAQIHQESPINPAPAAGSDDPAYVIYTSGSTGRPKGVEVGQRAAVSFIEAMRRASWLSPADTMLAVCAFTFDVHVADRWLALVSGVPVHLVPPDAVSDGARLLEVLRRSGATAMVTTPVTLRLLIEAGWSRNGPFKVVCGGEVLAPELAREVLARVDTLWNCYGPTETSVIATAFPVTALDDGPIPIGRPLENTRVYVMDEQGRPVAPGVTGELWIGGDGVALGYLGRPELTAEKFVPNPIAAREQALGLRPSPRLYRSGDQARLRPDGVLEFVGRRDFQVKVRGFRIELGEIEAVLEQHPRVRQSAVLVRDEGVRGPRLTAFVVPREPAPRSSELREHLRAALPEYMVPSLVHLLEELPTTPHGKIDRTRLAAMALDAHATDAATAAPADPLEHVLVRLWREVLDVPAIGVHDDFFELGGHSLLAMRVVSRLHDLLGARLSAQALFETPTPARLAVSVREHLADTAAGREVVALLDEAHQASDDQVAALVAQLWSLR